MLGALAPAALAAPLGSHQHDRHERRWHRYWQHHWDTDRPWFQRTVEIHPTATVSQPVTVRVLVPEPTIHTFAVPPFVSTVQHVVLPTLVQVVPAEYFVQTRLKLVQVQPNVFVLVHPSLFWGPEYAWAGYEYAAQLAAISPGFQPYFFDGPNGYGVYLAYQGGYYGY